MERRHGMCDADVKRSRRNYKILYGIGYNMIVETECSCGHTNHSEILLEWIKVGIVLLTCEKCNCVYTHKCSLDEETFNEQEEHDSPEMTTLNVAIKLL